MGDTLSVSVEGLSVFHVICSVLVGLVRRRTNETKSTPIIMKMYNLWEDRVPIRK
jgi:hypothetical protein